MKNSSTRIKSPDNVDKSHKPSFEGAAGPSSVFGSTKSSRFFDSSDRPANKVSGSRIAGDCLSFSSSSSSNSATVSSSNSSRVPAGHRQHNSSPPRSSSSNKSRDLQSGSSRYSSSQSQGSYYSTSNTGSVGGGSMASSSSSNLSKIVVAQVFLLASTMKEDKYDSQAAQIRQVRFKLEFTPLSLLPPKQPSESIGWINALEVLEFPEGSKLAFMLVRFAVTTVDHEASTTYIRNEIGFANMYKLLPFPLFSHFLINSSVNKTVWKFTPS